MSIRLRPSAAVVVLMFAAFTQASAQSPAKPAAAATAAASIPAADKPTTSLPYTPSLDVPSMDKAANPCADFYQYTCGGWVEKKPHPPHPARWRGFGQLDPG